MIHSFDIFDTLLFRRGGGPSAVFVEMARYLSLERGWRVTESGFTRARVAAEARAMTRLKRDPDIYEIYRELLQGLVRPEVSEHELADLEMRLQERALIPLEKHVLLVRACRTRGEVVFVSDMYLPSTFLRSVLIRHDIAEPHEAIYVSCEQRASKRAGTLFPKIIRERGVSPRELVHHGDDEVGDHRMPRRAGCQSRPLTAARFNRYEAILDAAAIETDGLGPSMAGAARLARLELAAKTESQQTIDVVGTSVAGPWLVAFVSWILKHSERSGIRRLYFLARDGQILHSVAQSLCEAWSLGIECRYLYASRQAWHLPSVDAVGTSELSWLLEKTDVSSVRHVLSRVNIDPREIEEALTRAGIDRNDWDTPLRDQGLRTLGHVLQGPALELVRSRAAAARELAIEYLRRERVLDGTPWALVDLGWRGRLQRSLVKILGNSGSTSRVEGYYMGLSADADASRHGSQLRSYFYDARSSVGINPLPPEFISFAELFCAATHGSTVGYEESDGKVSPVLKTQDNEPVLLWGLRRLHQAIGRYVLHVKDDRRIFDSDVDVRPTVARSLLSLTNAPTLAEAKVFGAFPFENDQGGTDAKAFASPISAAQVLKSVRRRQFATDRAVLWKAGSLRLSSAGVRSIGSAFVISKRMHAKVARRLNQCPLTGWVR